MGKYAAYLAYKDSGIEWLGDVPEHWEVRRLKFSADLISSKVNAKDSELQFTGLENIESFTGKMIQTNDELESDGVALCYQADDVLFCKLRPYLAKVYLASNSGLCTSELLVLRGIDVIPSFLKYYLLSQEFINIVDSSTYGSKMPRANWEFIGNLACLIPFGNEQQQIADFLDDKTAHLDKLIVQKQQMIGLLNEKRMALITQAVTKGLDLSVPMKDSGVEWLGSVPKHWGIIRLKFMIFTRKGIAFKSEDFSNDGIPVVKASDIKEKTIKPSNFRLPEEFCDLYPKAILNNGDLVLSTVGSVAEVKNSAVGQIGKVPQCLAGALLNQNTVVFSADEIRLLNEYLFFSLCCASYREHLDLYAHGTANQASLNIKDMLDFLASVPTIFEQQQIVNYLDAETQKIDNMIKTVNQAIVALQEYRTALITAAVTGKIDVRGFK